MTLTLEIPPELDAARREALATALSNAGLLNSEQAAALIRVPQIAPSLNTSLRQGSPEWKALLYQPGPGRGVILPPEATSREAIYDEGLR